MKLVSEQGRYSGEDHDGIGDITPSGRKGPPLRRTEVSAAGEVNAFTDMSRKEAAALAIVLTQHQHGRWRGKTLQSSGAGAILLL